MILNSEFNLQICFSMINLIDKINNKWDIKNIFVIFNTFRDKCDNEYYTLRKQNKFYAYNNSLFFLFGFHFIISEVLGPIHRFFKGPTLFIGLYCVINRRESLTKFKIKSLNLVVSWGVILGNFWPRIIPFISFIFFLLI
jgi:hypothetical protein